MGVKTIARRLGLARYTVRAALRLIGPPSYERVRKGSIVDAGRAGDPGAAAGLADTAATAIAERIGCEHSIGVLRERVAAVASHVSRF